jgi:hypothetical protein
MKTRNAECGWEMLGHGETIGKADKFYSEFAEKWIAVGESYFAGNNVSAYPRMIFEKLAVRRNTTDCLNVDE